MQGPSTFVTVAEAQALVGTDVGSSAWTLIDQPRVDAFAAVTADTNPLHLDPASAACAPFGGTIAHGFLTLSLVAGMAYEACPGIGAVGSTVNYGFDRIRFVAPVRTGSKVRGRFRLQALEVRDGGRWQARYEVTIEIEGQPTPALVAVWITAGRA